MINPVYTQVFRDQVWGFYVNDMEACRQATINAQSGGVLGGQNFTAALLTLSVIDFCTGFFKGKTKRADGRPEMTTAGDVAEFMSKYFTGYEKFKEIDFCKKFYQVFRHGLAHSWSPKGSGIGMDLTATEIVWLHGDIPILEVIPFYELTKQALKLYENDLGKDEDLNHKFIKRLEYLNDNDAAEAQTLRDMINDNES